VRARKAEKNVIDSVRHAYSEWRWRSAGVWAAYERWIAACEAERGLEFAAYRVALDLEERACRSYMELADRAARLRLTGPAHSAAAA
jgi:hypothetical protein